MDWTDHLRTDIHLAGLLGSTEVRDDHIVVRTPHNPGYYHGNYLLLSEVPTDLERWILRFQEAFGAEVRHCCLRWSGAGPPPELLDAAPGRAFQAYGGITMALDEPPGEKSSGTDWTVRRLKVPDEWEAMQTLDVASDGAESTAPSEYRIFKERLRATVLAWIEAGHATWWGVFRGEELLGQCGLAVCGDLGRFQSVQTHPAWRRRGVCSTLIATVARDVLGGWGCRRLLLEAEPDGPATGLYERLGFVETGRVHSLLRNDERVRVRTEVASDHAGVRSLVTAAFGSPVEADLIDTLRGRPGVISLVAERAGTLLGHVLFTPVTVAGDGATWTAVALGPMAVRPEQQRRGVGSALARAGLDACREAGYEVAFVLGHSEYYPRFGFRPAPALGLTCAWPVPDDAFMVHELRSGAIAGRTGRVAYDAAFDSAT